MHLRHEDVREIFALGGETLSVSQTGALLVNPKNKNFEALTDEKLEVFMNALITYSRGSKSEPHLLSMALTNNVYWLAEQGNEDALHALGVLLDDVLLQINEQAPPKK